MGLKDKMLKKAREIEERRPQFTPLELNEGNVQAIFNRCLATDETSKDNVSRSILFSRTLGYKPRDEIVFYFDRNKLLANKANIEYLYGQLKCSHQKLRDISIEASFYNYSGTKWTNNKAHLLELLYLGCTDEIDFISPFNAKTSSAVFAPNEIKPTLSPKDPAFPAWWEAHKAEWEA